MRGRSKYFIRTICWGAALCVFVAIILLMVSFVGTAGAGDVNVDAATTSTTATALNSARGAMTNNDVITFLAPNPSNPGVAVNMNAAIDLSGESGGIVINGSRSVTLSAGSGTGDIFARILNFNNGACFTNNNAQSTFLELSIGTNSVVYNNAVLGNNLNTLTVTGDGSTLSGTAAMGFTNQAAINGNFNLTGAGIKTFNAGVNVAAGKAMTITQGVHTFLGTTDIYGTVSTNSLAIDAINMGIVGGPATSSIVNIHTGGIVRTDGDGSWGLDLFKTSTVNISGALITMGGSSHAVVGQTDAGVKTVTVYNGGSITTGKSDDVSAGATAYGIRYAGSGTSANNNIIDIQSGGTVTTYGVDAMGVVVASYNDINIAGNITTHGTDGVHAGVDAHGVNVSSSNTINVSGNITTNGIGANGIRLSGTHDNITLSGKIETVDGVAIEGNNNNVVTVTSSGKIITGGTSRHGIYLTSSNTITSSGSISTSGESAYGMYLTQDSNTITIKNGGSVSTTGSAAYGIYIEKNDNRVTIENGGLIKTTNSNGHGILAVGSGNIITVDQGGSILTGSHGICTVTTLPADVGNNKVSIAGSVTTTGGGIGVYLSGQGNTATIRSTGTISTTGADAMGLYFRDGGGTGVISGTITTNGVRAHGFYGGGTGNTVTIAKTGSIITSGKASRALFLGSDSTVTLEGDGTRGATLATNYAGTHEPTIEAAHALSVEGSATTAASAGLVGGGSLAGGATNIINVQNGASITSRGQKSYGILASGNNNKITIDGSVHTYGVWGVGVIFNKNNDITLGSTGTITTEGAAAVGIYLHDNYNKITANGAILTKGAGSHGIYTLNDTDRGANANITLGGSITTQGTDGHGINLGAIDNVVTVSNGGSISTTGSNAQGIFLAKTGNHITVQNGATITTTGGTAAGIRVDGGSNIVTMGGSVTTTGTGAHGIFLQDNGNSAHISGSVSATGPSSYSLVSGLLSSGTGESNIFHLLNGASLTGGVNNLDADNDATSYLTFGYAKDANNKANLAAVDGAFNFTLGDKIDSASMGRWDGYFAGGTTTLSGTTNYMRNIFVGGASFDNAAVPDGAGGSVNLAAIGGATATLNVSQSIRTEGTVNIGAGSTYNLSGSHTQSGGGVVDIDGTLNITDSGTLNLGTSTTNLSGTINNTSTAALIIPTLDLDGDSTIGGSNTVSVTNALELDHNLNLSGTQAINLGTVNVTADKSITDSDNTALTGISALNVSSGKTGTLDGAGRISVNNADVDGTLVFSGAGTKMIYGTATLSGTITNNAGAAIIGTLDLDGDSILGGSGNISVNNALQLDNGLTLAGTNDVTLNTVNVTESKDITDNDNTGLTRITTLSLNAAKISTIGGAGAVTMTNVDIDTGGSLILSGGAKTITNLTMSGTLTNNAAAMTITTLDLDGNSVLSGSQKITVSNQVVLDHDLTLSNSGGVLFSNGLNTSAGGTLVNNTVITSDGVVLIADGDTYVITGEHNFVGGSFTSSPSSGTLKLDGSNAGGGIFNTTNTSSVNIAKLQVDGTKFGTISGSTAAVISNGMTVAGTLINSNTAGISSSGIANISGTYTINTKHTHRGSGDFTADGIINLSGTLDIDGSGTNSIATLDLTGDSTLDGDGNITVTNALTLDNNLTLAGSGDTTLGSVAINAGKALINNSNAGTQSIATLDIAGDGAELGGSGNTAVTNAVDIDNNFILSGGGSKTFGTVNLNTAGKSITDNGAGATSINTLQVTASATLNDTDATAATSISTASVSAGNTLTLGGAGKFSFNTLNMSGGLTNNAATTITTFNQLADLILAGTGTTTIVNAQTINANTLTLSGTGNTVFQSGLTIADGKKLTNNAKAQLATLTIANGHTATIEGTGVTTITSLANIDNGAALVNTSEIATAHTGTLAASYQLNGAHTQTAGTLTVTSLDVTGNNAEIGGAGTVIIAGALAVDNTLTLSGTGTRNFTGGVTLADGKTLTAKGGTNNINSLDVAGGTAGTGTIDGAGTVTLGSATNISGTLNNNGRITTAYDFNVATYNLGGTHVQTAGNFNVTTLDLTSDDSELINNGATVFSGNINIIKNLSLGGDGIKSFKGDVAVAAGKHLTLDGEGAKTIAGLVGLADGSSIISNGSGTTTVNAVTILPGATGAIEGDGKTVVSGTTTAATGTELLLNGSGAKTLADLDLGGTLTNNSPATITDLDLTATATIGGTGATTITNLLVIDHDLTLSDTGAKKFASGVNMLDGTSLINNGAGLATLASLVINSGSVTLDGSGPTVVTGTSSVEAGETLNITGAGDKSLADLDLSGILDVAAGATGTTTVANLDFSNGGVLNNNSGGIVKVGTLGIVSGVTGIIQGTSTTNVQNANVAGTLTKIGTGDLVVTGTGFNVSGANGFIDMAAANSGNLIITNGAKMTINSSHDVAGRGALDLAGDLNLTGELVVSSGSAVTTSGDLNSIAGSTYSLSGIHNHVGTGDVDIAGKLDLAGGGNFQNKATGGTQTIADLSVSSGSGTLGGSKATDVIVANIGGTLDFATTADSTFATTNLAGTLNQSSSSNLTLTTLNIGSGKEGTIAGLGTGTLTATDVFISSGGLLNLKRNLNIGNTLQNGGTLAVAATDSVTLNGDYTQTSSGLFQVEVTSSTVYSKLIVKGTANLSGSKGIDVLVTPNDSLANGDLLKEVLVADSLNAGNLVVTDNSAMWKFTGVVNGNSIDLKTERGLTLEQAVTDSPNVSSSFAMGAATSLEVLMQPGKASPDMEVVFDAMGTLETGNEIAEAVAQTVPILSGSMATLGLGMATDGATQIVNSRLNGISGLSSGDMIIENRTVWAKPFYTNTEQDTRNNIDGFSAYSFGLAIGGEVDFTPENRLGAAFSYGRGNVRGKETITNHQVDSDTWQITAYAENRLFENFDLNLIGAYGFNSNDSSRQIQFGGLNRTASASFDSWHLVLDAELLRSFAITNKLTLAPTLRTQYVYVGVEKYTETGAGDLSLNVDDSNADSFIASLGGRARYDLTSYQELSCFADVGYDFMADKSSITAAYTGGGPAFITDGNTPEKVVVHGGLGYKIITTLGPEFSVNYQVEARESSISHAGTMSFRLPF